MKKSVLLFIAFMIALVMAVLTDDKMDVMETTEMASLVENE